jgi:hypothetical protein
VASKDSTADVRVDETVHQELITPRQAAAMLTICTKTLRKVQREHSDLVHRYKIGSSPQGLRFARGEILALIERLREREDDDAGPSVVHMSPSL